MPLQVGLWVIFSSGNSEMINIIRWGSLIGYAVAALETPADRAAAILEEMTIEEKILM